MNQLPKHERARIIRMLTEGMSMRATARVMGVSINTVVKLFGDIGNACIDFHNSYVRNVNSKRVECDEIWSFCYTKQYNVPKAKRPPKNAGSVWTWTAIDSETRLLVSWLVAGRGKESAFVFVNDLWDRLSSESQRSVQINTDGHQPYKDAFADLLGNGNKYAQLVKCYETDQHKISRFTGVKRKAVFGRVREQEIGTAYVERQNLTMRMCMRRFTRKTNGHSKKFEKHVFAVALHSVWYNFCRRHETLKVSPAMAAGLDSEVRDAEWIVDLIEN